MSVCRMSSLQDLRDQLCVVCSEGNLDELLKIIYVNTNKCLDIFVNTDNHSAKTSPIHIVAKHGYISILEQLIRFGAAIDLLSDKGSPLAIACKYGHKDAIQFLLKHNARIHFPKDCEHLSPLHISCVQGYAEILELLIKSKPAVIFSDGQKLLHTSCLHGHLNCVKVLLQQGMSVNPPPIPTLGGMISRRDIIDTPLIGACQGGNVDVVQHLLENGAEVTTGVTEQYRDVMGNVFARYMENLHEIEQPEDCDQPLVAAQWKNKNIFSLHENWLTSFSRQLVNIDLSYNSLQDLPEAIFNSLPLLEKLDVSYNYLRNLPPIVDPSSSSLKNVNASNNQLVYVSETLFHALKLKKLDLSHNQLQSLHEPQDHMGILSSEDRGVQWNCISLRCLNLEYNQLECLPWGTSGAKNLMKFVVHHNLLSKFPQAWKCPMDILDLSNNRLTDFSSGVEVYWSQTLKVLNLQWNNLESISWNVCRLDMLRDLNLSHNKISCLPPPEYWTCIMIHKFDLSFNKLQAKPLTKDVPSPRRPSILRRMSSSEYSDSSIEETDAEFPVSLFSQTLETLDLSSNDLHQVPQSVCKLLSLYELDLGNNPSLKTLPAELGNLRSCWQLNLDKLNLTGLPRDVRPGNADFKRTLEYLRAKYRKAEPYFRMKLMVVGLQGRGKTTLLAALRGEELPLNVSTVGVVVNEWILPSTKGRKMLSRQSSPVITFSTWDLAGQQIYYATHQCFLSYNTLYLAVWNITHQEEGIETLRPWLLNIQARAPNSHVIIVGTHADLLQSENRKESFHKLLEKINKEYQKKGYPKIVGSTIVSSATAENLDNLREIIYKSAMNMKDQHTSVNGEALIGRKVPLSYIQLQSSIIKEAQRRRKDREPPILSEDDLLQLAKNNPNNDIEEKEEIQAAVSFLVGNGILLHFSDQLRGLNNLYFIDPPWLCDLMALLVTVRERNPYVESGVINKKNIKMLLRDPRLPSEFLPQYLQLMERFEIALALDKDRLLIPAMLPREKPGLQIHQFHVPTTSSINNLQRRYQMSYIPSGFWSRLIARLMIAVQRWASTENLIMDDKYMRSSIAALGNPPLGYSLIYWREGIGVIYPVGHFLVESFKDWIKHRRKPIELQGINITVASAVNDFSVMGFVVDEIDALISEWYPGLEEIDHHGMPLIKRLVPCPVCPIMSNAPEDKHKTWSPQAFSSRGSTSIHHFSLATCAAAALNFASIECPNHKEKYVALRDLVPDLLLTDLPPELSVSKEQLEFVPSVTTRLGGGGAGEVYKGKYQSNPVAVKQFHTTQHTRGMFFDSGVDSMSESCFHGKHCSETVDRGLNPTVEDELQMTKAVKAFWELRQEVAVLSRLRHPCIVSLLGVSLQPLCFVLELAPHGDLITVLEDRQREREEQSEGFIEQGVLQDSVLGRTLTYKIAFQVISALSYLHDSDIIYRDLKSDNVLVWSVNKDDVVNVKLSDYGISRFVSPQGVAGEEGTPGYQAPEVQGRSVYNEKADIFSFGIFLYELISSKRPYREYCSPHAMKKAIQRGIRPSLAKLNISSYIPRLEALMSKCWVQSPDRRPAAKDIVRDMRDPAFLCHRRTLPTDGLLNEVTAIFPLYHKETGNPMSNPSCSSLRSSFTQRHHQSLLLWSRQRTERCYTIIDCDSGVNSAKDKSCPGHRVLCVARVGNRIWLGTEGCSIEVFGRLTWGEPEILWTFNLRAHVLALLPDETETSNGQENHMVEGEVTRVFVTLDSGCLVILSRGETDSIVPREKPRIDPKVPRESEALVLEEASEWNRIQTISLCDGAPAKCLAFVNDRKELWVGCGKHIVIVDKASISILQKLKVYSSDRRHVRQIVVKDDRVWTIDRSTPEVLQWCSSSRQLTFIFDCSSVESFGLVIAQQVEMTAKKHGEDHDDPAVVQHGDEDENNYDYDDHDVISSCLIPPSLPEIPSPEPSSGVSCFSFASFSGMKSNVKSTSTTSIPSPPPSDTAVNPSSPVDVPGSSRVKDWLETVSTESPDSAISSLPATSQHSAQNDLIIAENEPSRFKRVPSLMKKRKSSSRKKLLSPFTIQLPNRGSLTMRPQTVPVSRTATRVTSLAHINDTLWLGRGTGDVIVVNLNSDDSNSFYGHVIAQLNCHDNRNYLPGQIEEVVNVSEDKIACLRRLEPRRPINSEQKNMQARQGLHSEDHTVRYQLVIWQGWGGPCFGRFQQNVDQLYELEMREQEFEDAE